MRAGRHELPAPLLLLRVQDVVPRALLGAAENGVGFADLAESRRVPGFVIVRMKTLREEPIDPMIVGPRSTDLQQFVVVLRPDWVGCVV